MNQENRWKSSFQNWISVIAGIAAIVLFACLLFLIILDFIAKEHNPYVEAVAFLILPGFLVAALLLVVYGAWRERRQRVKRGYVRRFPHIDFNHPTHQKIALVAVGVVTLFLLFSMYGTYRAYEFTESVAFCGTICHQVMEPEHTAYQHSPHARVTCVQCHIGPGAGWYVRSKLSGAYQIYSVVAKKYSRPIETPVKNLRPAQETCEQCHWPQKFFGAIDQDRHYFLSDETNTPWNVRMLMFVGGGTPPYGKREGIHWHMNINNKVYYVASDEKRQTIPWVKAIHPDGKEEVFVDKESEFTADKPPAGEMRRMDCIDCHNRPSHVFKSPDATVNEAMAYGAIDRELPFIKRESVKALLGKYDSKDSAREGIRTYLENFYQKKYPQVASERKEKISKAAEALATIYEQNSFPKMNVSWKVYPNNIGHWVSPGCFRCHDGKHESPSGKVISNDCKVCHNIIAQGPPSVMESSVDGLEFKHPQDIQDAWKEMACYECHTGGSN